MSWFYRNTAKHFVLYASLRGFEFSKAEYSAFCRSYKGLVNMLVNADIDRLPERWSYLAEILNEFLLKIFKESDIRIRGFCDNLAVK